jgi:hypothetical protein
VSVKHLSVWLPRTARKWESAWAQLLEAEFYARDLNRPLYEFAVPLATLAETGLTANDLGWLSAKGYVEQPVPAGKPTALSLRIHRALGTCPSSSQKTVVLTKTGVAFARRVCGRRQGEEGKVLSTDDNDESLSQSLPRWDPEGRTLWLGPTLVKHYKVPALNQELVLAAFAEEGWPTFIDDPLPPVSGVDAKHRLHDTIARLNRAQKRRLIRFHGNGNGLAVHWERIPPVSAIGTRSTTDRL